LAMVRLAIHRTDLAERNENVPPLVPAVWAALGHFTRAEALARSIANPNRRDQALSAVAMEVPEPSDTGSADTLGVRAEDLVGSITDSMWRDQTLANMARAAAIAGDTTGPRPWSAPSLLLSRPGRWPTSLRQCPWPGIPSEPRPWPAPSPIRPSKHGH
jgi:hypothetical protein